MNTSAALPDNDGIPRLTYLGRILQLCFFPLLTVLAGVIVLSVVPQAREALLAFADEQLFSQEIFFALAFIVWLLSAWYVARLLVGKRFHPDLIGQCVSGSFSRAVAVWLPRSLALIAGIPVTCLILFDAKRLILGLVLALSCIAIFAFLVFRKHLGRKLHQAWVSKWVQRPFDNFERFDDLSSASWLFIGLLAAVSAGLLVALPVAMETIARPIGSPALLLLALMSWTIFGGFVLTYFPKSIGLPVLTSITAAAAIVFSLWNENHPVAPARPGIQNAAPTSLDVNFKDWLKARPHPDAPVIFIATAGGASRAAYWTTSALGLLQDDRGNRSSFSDNVFLISGISGGSVGAAAFVTSLDIVRNTKVASCGSVREIGNSVTGQDDLATVIGLMLFPDLFQRFWPVPVLAADRSRGLEEVWERDWAKIIARCGSGGAPGNPWSDAFTALNSKRERQGWLPALALSSTALAQGRPVMQWPFDLPRGDAAQLLAANLATQSLTLAQAAHNSARFPYVSPAGVVRGTDGKRWDRLGDGGYIEASGTMVLAEVIRALERSNRIRTARDAESCRQPGEPPSDDNACVALKQIKIVVLDNSATKDTQWLCSVDGKPNPADLDSRVPAGSAKHWLPLPDLSAPIQGAFSTRGGRALTAQVDLLQLVGGCGENFAEIRLPDDARQRMPSMSWMLDKDSRTMIDDVLQKPQPRRPLAVNLNRVRGWLQ